METTPANHTEAHPAGQSAGGDPVWLYGLIPWWLGFTLAIMLVADHRVPAHGGWALAGQIALGLGLVASGSCMIVALLRRRAEPSEG